MDKNSPIGFFDSGVGGLSVYSRFKNLLPNENTMYYGDLKNMPYGNKAENELIRFAANILDFFNSKKVKAVVIACNTSSAVAYEKVKDNYDFKIYPIIQSSAKEIIKSNYKKIGVFATKATINTGAYKRELQKYQSNIQVFEMACPMWTNFVENGLIDSEECKNDVKLNIERMLLNNPDKIILGCTHYPYLMNIFEKYSNIDIYIDPAIVFVDYIKSDLEKNDLLALDKNKGYEQFYVSAFPELFVKNAKLFYEVKELPILV